VINKNVDFDAVAQTVNDAFALGWKVIKLYFMIGLPTESDEDILAIVEMVEKLLRIKGARRRNAINVSVASFIPKPHTPFQWADQIDLAQSQRKLSMLKSAFNTPGIQIKWQNPEMSLLEGVLSRGDRRLSAVIEAAVDNGCRFDGWTDRFNFRLWRECFARCHISIDFYSTRKRELDEPLPWAIMDSGVSDTFLKNQWYSAMSEEKLSDCRYGECHGCGICDFDSIRPVTFSMVDKVPHEFDDSHQPEELDTFVKWDFVYRKCDQARFFGHLELIHIFARALRRAGVPVQYSQGFHPMPRISFDDPIPVGMESEGERMRIVVHAEHANNELAERINRQLPEGLHIVSSYSSDGRGWSKQSVLHYVIDPGKHIIDGGKIQTFHKSKEWPHTRDPNRGGRTIDLKSCVRDLRMEKGRLLLCTLPVDGHLVRPMEIMKAVFDIEPQTLSSFRILKRVVDMEQSIG
jgi:radical SAM-linked protein